MTTPSVETIEHLTHLLGFIQSKHYHAEDPALISGTIKRSRQSQLSKKSFQLSMLEEAKNYTFKSSLGKKDVRIKNFQVENQKLEWVGINFGSQMAAKIQISVRQLAEKEKTEQIRFWGVIKGTQADYYVTQGLKQVPKSHDSPAASNEKLGQGVNYYSFWVCNDPTADDWVCLPQIAPQHIKCARKIKKMFTGNLQNKIDSEPAFNGTQKHYLKAQLCRLTHSLQIAPKGIYKPNDQNPKIVQFEDEVKIPEVQEMNSLQGWIHRNQMILELGRCSHYVDPTLPQDQIQQKMSELAQKDPQVERLRGITEDKVPEALNLGMESPWILKFQGDSQVFTKDEASLVYGVAVLKNIFWPGWVTLGYKNGYTNFYIGDGLKNLQSSWDKYTNEDLQEEGGDLEQFSEPNPKEQPKAQEPVEGQGQPVVDQ